MAHRETQLCSMSSVCWVSYNKTFYFSFLNHETSTFFGSKVILV